MAYEDEEAPVRRTTRMAAAGSVRPGLAAAMAASFHMVMLALKMRASTHAGRYMPLAPCADSGGKITLSLKVG